MDTDKTVKPVAAQTSQAPRMDARRDTRSNGGRPNGAPHRLKKRGRPDRGRGGKPFGAPRSHGSQGRDGYGPKPEDTIPPLAEGVVRIIPLGGVEEVGKNMTMVEYGNDIIVIDAGFQFKEESTPGIDYILPNTKYPRSNHYPRTLRPHRWYSLHHGSYW
jgi:ribonuclease J